MTPTIRRATPADAEALARGAVEGVVDYGAFAPPGWTGPAYDAELAHTRELLADPDFHCFVAELDGAVVGQVTTVPAAKAARPVEEPGLCHLRNLYVDRARWGHYLDALRNEPGVVVISSGRSGGRHVVTGLRDPIARDPQELIASSRLSPDDVIGRWEPYQALTPSFVLTRARRALQPPAGVTLAFNDGVLSAAGEAPAAWSRLRRCPAPGASHRSSRRRRLQRAFGIGFACLRPA